MIQIIIFDFFGVIYNPRTGDLMDGLEDFMKEISHRQLRCGIASSSVSEQIRDIVGQAPFANQFETIVGAYDVHNTKPNPECYQKVADFFNVTPQQCLVIDDSASAISAAQQTGFNTILFGVDVPTFQAIDLDTHLNML